MSDMWMLPSYRGKRWPYLQMPGIGDGIRYMDDGFDVSVQEIRVAYVLFSDGTRMRRRLDWNRISAWIGSNNFATSVRSWRRKERRRQTWVDAGAVQYNV